MFRWIWEVVVVVAATIAVLTNVVIIASEWDVSKELQRMQSDINELYNAKVMAENRDLQIQQALVELHAQVHWGLSERYPDYVEE